MKKLAILFSVIALVFAVSTLSAQNAPDKKPTKKAATEKTVTSAPAVEKSHVKGDCGGEKAAAAAKSSDCATPCTDSKAKSGCCDDKAKAAKPVPAPDKK